MRFATWSTLSDASESIITTVALLLFLIPAANAIVGEGPEGPKGPEITKVPEVPKGPKHVDLTFIIPNDETIYNDGQIGNISWNINPRGHDLTDVTADVFLMNECGVKFEFLLERNVPLLDKGAKNLTYDKSWVLPGDGYFIGLESLQLGGYISGFFRSHNFTVAGPGLFSFGPYPPLC